MIKSSFGKALEDGLQKAVKKRIERIKNDKRFAGSLADGIKIENEEQKMGLSDKNSLSQNKQSSSKSKQTVNVPGTDRSNIDTFMRLTARSVLPQNTQSFNNKQKSKGYGLTEEEEAKKNEKWLIFLRKKMFIRRRMMERQNIPE